ncbi:MAG: hypothetical protein ACXAB7_17265 [Candidatus Kariarchaeaceae archaeon]|jgi:rRNA maturation protein Rpf1
MVHAGTRILITTTRRPSESARSFCKVLHHIIPRSILIRRGSSNEQMLHEEAVASNSDYLLIVTSKGNRLNHIIIKEVKENKLVELPLQMRFLQYIDPKIFGFKQLPARGPLSTTRESRQHYPELVDFMEKYFLIEINQKNPLWLMIDKNERRSYIQFVDALTQQKFLFAEVKLVRT